MSWCVFWLALALRIAWIGWRWVQVGAQLEFPDEQIHWQLASNLVHHGSLVTDDGRFVARMPLYPLLLVPFATLADSGVLAARLFQALLGAFTAWLCARLASAAFPSRGWIAGLLAAGDPFSIFFSNLLLTETAFMPIAVGLTACAWRLAIEPDGRQLGLVSLVGVLSSASIFIRPAALPWVVSVWGVLLLMDRFRFRTLARVGLFVVVLCVALIPWGLRNRAVVGGFAWLSANGGVTLYDAQGPQADGSSNQAFLHKLPELAGLGEIELDRRLERMALDQMRHDPGRIAQLALVKLGRTWNPLPNVVEYRAGSSALVGATFTTVVLAAAILGVIRVLTTRLKSAAVSRWLLLVALPVLTFSLLHCIYVGSVRYRVPLMPFIEMLGMTAVVPRLTSIKTSDNPLSLESA